MSEGGGPGAAGASRGTEAAPPPAPPETPEEAKQEEKRKSDGGGGTAAPGEGERRDSVSEHPSQVPLTKKQEAKSCCKDACTYLYNKEQHTVMGRGCRQWVMLIVFYILFYLAIAALFIGLFGIILFMSNKSKPRMVWTQPRVFQRSNIQQHPSVILTPGPDREKNPDSSLMMFTAASAPIWRTKLENFFTGYETYQAQHPGCVPPVCFQFNRGTSLPNVPPTESCSVANGFGYDVLSPIPGNPSYRTIYPTFVFRPTKIIGWKPEPFADQADFNAIVAGKHGLPRIANQWVPLNLDQSKDHVMILCQGETAAEDQLLGKAKYCTATHMHRDFYPYTNQSPYLPPFVIIQFVDVKPGIPVSVECFVVTRNMVVDRKRSLGVDRFEIYRSQI